LTNKSYNSKLQIVCSKLGHFFETKLNLLNTYSNSPWSANYIYKYISPNNTKVKRISNYKTWQRY